MYEESKSNPEVLELLNKALEAEYKAERIKRECRAEREDRKRSRKADIRNKRASKRWAMSQWEV